MLRTTSRRSAPSKFSTTLPPAACTAGPGGSPPPGCRPFTTTPVPRYRCASSFSCCVGGPACARAVASVSAGDSGEEPGASFSLGVGAGAPPGPGAGAWQAARTSGSAQASATRTNVRFGMGFRVCTLFSLCVRMPVRGASLRLSQFARTRVTAAAAGSADRRPPTRGRPARASRWTARWPTPWRPATAVRAPPRAGSGRPAAGRPRPPRPRAPPGAVPRALRRRRAPAGSRRASRPRAVAVTGMLPGPATTGWIVVLGPTATLSASSSVSSPSASRTRSGRTSATTRPLICSPCATRRDLPPLVSRRNAVALPSTISVPCSVNCPRCIRGFAASATAVGAGRRVGLKSVRSTTSRPPSGDAAGWYSGSIASVSACGAAADSGGGTRKNARPQSVCQRMSSSSAAIGTSQ